jgi:hypothetical protein
MIHNPNPTMACTGTIQLFLLPHLGTNHASTIGDQRSLREYGHVASAKTASWEYERWDLRRKGRVPNVRPRGMPWRLFRQHGQGNGIGSNGHKAK